MNKFVDGGIYTTVRLNKYRYYKITELGEKVRAILLKSNDVYRCWPVKNSIG